MNTRTVTIEKVVPGGAGIARHKGKVIFLRGVLPGEQVSANIISSRKDYSVAEAAEIMIPSPGRITPPCRYYSVCGGCDLQHADYYLQLQIKQDILRDAVLRIGKLDIPPEDITVFPSRQWKYRRRARFHRSKDGSLGFRRESSREVVPIDDCPVLDPRLNELLGASSEQADFRYSVVAGDTGIADGENTTEITLRDSRRLERTLMLDGRVFFQSNVSALTPILDMLTWKPEGGRAVDLYSGVGTFASFLEEHYEQVTAVEGDNRCLFYAGKNLSPRTRFMTKPVEDWSGEAHQGSIDRLVIDPPRSGAGRAVLEKMFSLKPKSTVLISCNPSTFARDLNTAVSLGCRLEALAGIDLYPQTSHVECAAFLTLD